MSVWTRSVSSIDKYVQKTSHTTSLVTTTVVPGVVSTKPNPKLTLLFRRNQLVIVPRDVSERVASDSDL